MFTNFATLTLKAWLFNEVKLIHVISHANINTAETWHRSCLWLWGSCREELKHENVIKTLLRHSLFSPLKQNLNSEINFLFKHIMPLSTNVWIFTDSSPTKRWGKDCICSLCFLLGGTQCSLSGFRARSQRSSCAERRRCVCVLAGVSRCSVLLRVFLLVVLQVLQILQHLLDQRGHGARDLHLQCHHPLSSCGNGCVFIKHTLLYITKPLVLHHLVFKGHLNKK